MVGQMKCRAAAQRGRQVLIASFPGRFAVSRLVIRDHLQDQSRILAPRHRREIYTAVAEMSKAIEKLATACWKDTRPGSRWNSA